MILASSLLKLNIFSAFTDVISKRELRLIVECAVACDFCSPCLYGEDESEGAVE